MGDEKEIGPILAHCTLKEQASQVGGCHPCKGFFASDESTVLALTAKLRLQSNSHFK
jgi:hypothetical protein